MSFWLWVDLAAAMPFDAIVQAAVNNPNTDQLRSVRLVRILRLVRLGKLYKLAKFGWVKEALDRHNVTPAFLGLLFLCFQVVVFAHLVACFWYVPSRRSSLPNSTQPCLQSGYLQSCLQSGL